MQATLSKLRRRIIIQKAEKYSDDKGVVHYEYPRNKYFRVYAMIEIWNAKVTSEQAETVPELEYHITIRYRNDIDINDRVEYSGKIFEQTVPAKDIDVLHRWLQLTCREKVKSNA